MTKTSDEEDRQWDRSWYEHKVRQLVRLARLPLAEKPAWLEDAQALVEALAAARKQRVSGTPPH